MIRLARHLAVVIMASGMMVLGTSSAQADDPVTDLAVHLNGVGFLGGGEFGRFEISITNNGSDPLQSATVTLHSDRLVLSAMQTPCSLDFGTATVTCQFGALAVGATASTSSVLWLSLGQGLDVVHLTATRVASIPADPNPTNDTATETCRWWGWPGPPIGSPLRC